MDLCVAGFALGLGSEALLTREEVALVQLQRVGWLKIQTYESCSALQIIVRCCGDSGHVCAYACVCACEVSQARSSESEHLFHANERA